MNYASNKFIKHNKIATTFDSSNGLLDALVPPWPWYRSSLVIVSHPGWTKIRKHVSIFMTCALKCSIDLTPLALGLGLETYVGILQNANICHSEIKSSYFFQTKSQLQYKMKRLIWFFSPQILLDESTISSKEIQIFKMKIQYVQKSQYLKWKYNLSSTEKEPLHE